MAIDVGCESIQNLETTTEVARKINSNFEKVQTAVEALEDEITNTATELAASSGFIVRVNFGSTFLGNTYTLTNGSDETYTGTVAASLSVDIAVKHANTEYTIFCLADGTTWEKAITISNYFGIYETTLASATTVLENNSWDLIRDVSNAGLAPNYWSVGDEKSIVIDGNVGLTNFKNFKINTFILGFDHNSDREGQNRIHFQIGKISSKLISFTDSIYNSSVTAGGYFSMNLTNTNSGGWKNSYMRTTLLGSTMSPLTPAENSLMAALPSDLRAVMKSVVKYSDNTGGGSNTASYVTATTDYLFLLSEFEYHGSRSYANSAEQNYQTRYAYYTAGNSKVHYRSNSTSSSAYSWCRSVSYLDATLFCLVITNGGATNTNACRSYGVAPGFCV